MTNSGVGAIRPPIRMGLFGRPEPNATTWVMRDKEGQMVPIKVTDMTNDHLYRWVHYFRRKYRDQGFNGPDGALDTAIQRTMVTAPAIYAEANKRGVLYTAPPPEPPDARSGPTPEVTPGRRRIQLEEDD